MYRAHPFSTFRLRRVIFVLVILLALVSLARLPLEISITPAEDLPPQNTSLSITSGGGALIAILSTSDSHGRLRREYVRRWMAKYKSALTIPETTEASSTVLPLRYFFVVDSSRQSYWEGDILHLKAPSGYRELGQKVRDLFLYTANHFEPFQFMIKTDDDSIMCLNRLANALTHIPRTELRKVYGGKIVNADIASWTEQTFYDPSFIGDTLNTLKLSHPYGSGAGYVVGWDLIQFIKKNAAELLIYQVEDLMVGTWLFGLRRHWVTFDGDWSSCTCSTWAQEGQIIPNKEGGKDDSVVWRDTMVNFHGCKTKQQIESCHRLWQNDVC